MTRLSTVHTFVFAALVPLAVYARNRHEAPIDDLIAPLALVIGVNAMIQLGVRLMRWQPARINIVVSAGWLAFFLFMPTVALTDLRIRHVFALYTILGAGVLAVAARASAASIARATQAMVIMGAFMTINPLRVVAAEAFRSKQLHGTDAHVAVQNGGAADLPDIYYIILDGYTSSGALRKFFEYDNSEFDEFLSANGFYVAEQSRSNYASTINSLATSLNMEYAASWTDHDPVRVRRRIHNSRVFQTVRQHGYRVTFLTMTSHLRADAPTPFIDEHIAFGGISGLPQYQMTLLGMTPLRLVLAAGDRTPLRRFAGRVDRDGKLWKPEGIDWTLDQLTRLGGGGEPTFVFAHVLSPHSPFYHDAACSVVERYATESWNNFSRDFDEYRRAYVGQLQCLNRKVTAALSELLRRKPDAIVILQADHGAPEIMDASIQRHDPTWDRAEFRFSILNAYRVPAAVRERLYDEISPVNSFRALLAGSYTPDLQGFLPDVSYWQENGKHVPADPSGPLTLSHSVQHSLGVGQDPTIVDPIVP